jgi:hypothetical protein
MPLPRVSEQAYRSITGTVDERRRHALELLEKENPHLVSGFDQEVVDAISDMYCIIHAEQTIRGRKMPVVTKEIFIDVVGAQLADKSPELEAMLESLEKKDQMLADHLKAALSEDQKRDGKVIVDSKLLLGALLAYEMLERAADYEAEQRDIEKAYS